MISKDAGVTLSFGAIGGLFAPVAQSIVRAQGDLQAFEFPDMPSLYWPLFTILGAITAWLSVFAANSNKEDLRHLSAFALVCGLGFPSLLLSTLNDSTRASLSSIRAVQAGVEEGSLENEELSSFVLPAAIEILSSTPASEAGREGASLIATDTQELVDTISRSDPRTAEEIVSAANAAGYRDVVVRRFTINTRGLVVRSEATTNCPSRPKVRVFNDSNLLMSLVATHLTPGAGETRHAVVSIEGTHLGQQYSATPRIDEGTVELIDVPGGQDLVLEIWGLKECEAEFRLAEAG